MPSPRTMAAVIASPFLRNASPWPSILRRSVSETSEPQSCTSPRSDVVTPAAFTKMFDQHRADHRRLHALGGSGSSSALIFWDMDLPLDALAVAQYVHQQQDYGIVHALAQAVTTLLPYHSMTSAQVPLSLLIWATFGTFQGSPTPSLSRCGSHCNQHAVARLYGNTLAIRWWNPCDPMALNIVLVYFKLGSQLLSLRLFFVEGHVNIAGHFGIVRSNFTRSLDSYFWELFALGNDESTDIWLNSGVAMTRT